MALDDAMHRGEADAGAFELLGLVQALKGQEQLVGTGRIEAGAVVANAVDGFVPLLR